MATGSTAFSPVARTPLSVSDTFFGDFLWTTIIGISHKKTIHWNLLDIREFFLRISFFHGHLELSSDLDVFQLSNFSGFSCFIKTFFATEFTNLFNFATLALLSMKKSAFERN